MVSIAIEVEWNLIEQVCILQGANCKIVKKADLRTGYCSGQTYL